MSNRFPEYTTDYIAGGLSLRKPQARSLKILEEILAAVPLKKGLALAPALSVVHGLFPTCTDFERDFPSLTFALATGVGKTRLMGAFIAFLYTRYGLRNFFVVAPNTTIYEKLRTDLGVPGSAKYVFSGLGCFSSPPEVVTEEDYRTKGISLFSSDIRLFIYNIDKFNKENANMRRLNEVIGDSFYRYLAGLPDLVLLMDESHHYRAERGAQALNELSPTLGLKLTATPLVTKGTKQVPFKNVVYEYPLSRAIEDGYTRTPFAVTRTDIDSYHFGEAELDRLMLTDGIACHERAKQRLTAYAKNHGLPRVKPFMLVVCKDTSHAEEVERFVTSDAFRGGAYRKKTIVVHSKQRGAETEANMRLLLDVESPENPVEIVIHVNMLKEGWDVNNLYTIVPLRTAASKILREQMVGRGLRLPYGVRTGDRDVDAVMLTAHDKFKEILEEAQKGDSIFKAGNVIRAEDITEEKIVQTTLNLDTDEDLEKAYMETGLEKTEKNNQLLQKVSSLITGTVSDRLQKNPEHSHAPYASNGAEDVKAKLEENVDLADVYRANQNPLDAWIEKRIIEVYRKAEKKFIPIPQIKVMETGAAEVIFEEFELDLTDFSHAPIENDILILNLEDPADIARVKGEAIDFDGYNPAKKIVELLREKPEIDYEACSGLLFKLISAACSHYERKYGMSGLRNIVMMYKRDIAEKIYRQMLCHAKKEDGIFIEEIVGTRKVNLQSSYTYTERVNLYGSFKGNIKSVLFDGITKGVFSEAKFDSAEGELTFARIIERDEDVLNWLRPAEREFDLLYGNGRHYHPDFVVETAEKIYLVEVKGRDKLQEPDVLLKKERGISYCAAATRWGRANGYKAWSYLFIPADEIFPNSTFARLAKQYGNR